MRMIMAESRQFEAGQKVTLSFVISEEEQAEFSRLSGDCNPIHLDPAAAAERGFSGPVVFGGLLVAKVSRVIGMHIPGPKGLWATLEIRFRRPLLVGEQAVLDAVIDDVSWGTRSLTLAIVIASQGRQIATATSLVTLFP